MTLPPSGWWHIQLAHPLGDSGYESDEALLSDLSAAVHQEILTLYAHGLRNIQIDDPNLSFFCDEEWISICKSNGTDLERLWAMYLKSHNDVVRDLPDELAVGLHICRGNFPNGVGLASGSYERIAKRLFTGCAYRLFYLEFDSPWAGDFSPLAYLPVEKGVV